MKKNKIYRPLGNLLLAKGIIGCITSVPIFFITSLVLTCAPGSFWCRAPIFVKVLSIITLLFLAFVNIHFIITGMKMRRETLSKVELYKKTGAAATMAALNIIGAILTFVFGMWAIILWFGIDLFLSIAVLVSCIGYHKQIKAE